MSRPEPYGTIRVMEIDGPDANLPGIEGSVWYEVEHPDGTMTPLRQRFNSDGKDDAHGHVWRRTGGTVEGKDLSLSPSFLCRWKQGDVDMVVHLFLRDGKIDLCGDSNVTLK